MKYKQILAFGDSVVFGDELTKSFCPQQQNQLAFPGVLGELLDIPVINCAMIGGSNVRSLRVLPEMLLAYPNSLVLFCYTSFDRSEFYLPTADQSIPNDQFHVPLGINFTHANAGKEHQFYNETYLKYFCHPVHEKFNWREYNALFTVQTFCEHYAADYRQIFLYGDMIFNHSLEQSVILEHVDREKIIQFGNFHDNLGKGSVYSWLRQQHANFCPGGHPDKDAHQQIAKHILEHL